MFIVPTPVKCLDLSSFSPPPSLIASLVALYGAGKGDVANQRVTSKEIAHRKNAKAKKNT